MPKVPRESVEYFLAEHDLYSPLIEAVARLKVYFPDMRLRLEMIDHFDMPGLRQLRITAETDLEPEKAVAALKEFDYNWWLDQPDHLHDLFLITIS